MPEYREAPWGITWDGPVPDPLWQTELNRLFKPGGNLQWLTVYWEPGYAWQPVERWVIGRVWPQSLLPGWIEREWLDGPNPGVLGHWDLRRSRWVSEAPPISRMQWRLWHEKGSLVEPYWICQGSVGGHRYRWNRMEQIVSRVHGGPENPPPPGDLPYAEPDRRTFAMLAQRDRVRMGLATLDFVYQGGELQTEDERELADEARQSVWNWLSEQARDWAEHAASHALRPLWEHQRKTGSREHDLRLGREAERLEADFMAGAL